jgi:hypothetical protein
MNTFTVIALLGAAGAVFTYFKGVRTLAVYGDAGRDPKRWLIWHFLFEVTTFVTILAAPLARIH